MAHVNYVTKNINNGFQWHVGCWVPKCLWKTEVRCSWKILPFLSSQKKQTGLFLCHLLGQESTTSYSCITPLGKEKFRAMQYINQHWEFSLHHGGELLFQGGYYILNKEAEENSQWWKELVQSHLNDLAEEYHATWMNLTNICSKLVSRLQSAHDASLTTHLLHF